jgi:hypothetical protein
MAVDAAYGGVVVQVEPEPGCVSIGRGDFVNDDVDVVDGVQWLVKTVSTGPRRVTVVPVVPVPGLFPVVSMSIATWLIWLATPQPPVGHGVGEGVGGG